MRSARGFKNLTELFRSLDLGETQAEVYRESRGRIVLVGPVSAGKSSLYNCLQGWTVSPVQHTARELCEPVEEPLGLFTLIDLPNAVGPPARSETGQGGGTPRGWDRALERPPTADRRPPEQPPQVVPHRWDRSGADRSEGVGRNEAGWSEARQGDFSTGYVLEPYDGLLDGRDGWRVQEPVLWSVMDADLVIFVIDGAAGLQPVDYQWFARIRATGCPIFAVLNKIDLLGDETDPVIQDLRRRLAAPVVPVSAREGTNVHDLLLPQILDMCPSLTVPVGREVASCRRGAAVQLIQRSAMMCGLLGVEPMPLLDVPFQLMIQMRLVMRIAAMYGRVSLDGHADGGIGFGSGAGLNALTLGAGREVIMALLSSLGLRYLTQQLIKLVPLLGWLLSGLLSASSTWVIGRAAVAYFERAQDGSRLVAVPDGFVERLLRVRGRG